MPKVSIIIPVYNAEKTLAKCLNSILAQTLKDIEIICVNDGSKDSSSDILNNYAQADTRIKIFNQNNAGPAMARHNAISHATGDYLMFCDSDDWVESEWAETMVNIIEKENVDIAMCDCNVIDLANKTMQNENTIKYHYLRLAGYNNLNITNINNISVVLWNKIFKQEIIKHYNIEYPQRYEHDDTIFFFKYLSVAKTYYGIPKKLYNYVVGQPDSIMGHVIKNTNKSKGDTIYAFKDLFSFIEKFDNPDFQKYIQDVFVRHCDYFFQYLTRSEREKYFQELVLFINENSFFKKCNTPQIEKIKKTKTYKEFQKILKNEQLSLLEQLFSIKNTKHGNIKHKMLTVLGLKIKFHRKLDNSKIQIAEN